MYVNECVIVTLAGVVVFLLICTDPIEILNSYMYKSIYYYLHLCYINKTPKVFQ